MQYVKDANRLNGWWAMPLISADLMYRTWQRVGALDEREILRIHKAHRKEQSTLTLFVLNDLPHVRKEASGVLIYVYHVVLEAFLRSGGRPKRVGKSEIERVALAVESGGRLEADTLDEGSMSEPHAVRYVIEALTEVDDPVLTKHEIERFLQTLWVAIECLHAACRVK